MLVDRGTSPVGGHPIQAMSIGRVRGGFVKYVVGLKTSTTLLNV